MYTECCSFGQRQRRNFASRETGNELGCLLRQLQRIIADRSRLGYGLPLRFDVIFGANRNWMWCVLVDC